MRIRATILAIVLCVPPTATLADDRTEADALRFIEGGLGGGYVRDDKLPRKPVYWVRIQGLTDADLDRLRPLDKLRYLNLSGTRITDTGLERLRHWRELEDVELSSSAVTDA